MNRDITRIIHAMKSSLAKSADVKFSLMAQEAIIETTVQTA